MGWLCAVMERQDYLNCLILGEKPNVKRLPSVWKIPITWLSETRKAKKTEKDQRLQGVLENHKTFQDSQINFYDDVIVDICRYLPKPIECTKAKMNPNVTASFG